ncbi:hypothetical protein BpHYR1_035481 [Brachionus plicatilis]|uniref:Uncharacterized protein n=1 Tax=Brachionus plicatilis TaxID=10195 RepID=A0A3M7RQY6_BRAPC|nr:hypothetical protein BpHYR1_035481 [Brachionus plicatilis]
MEDKSSSKHFPFSLLVLNSFSFKIKCEWNFLKEAFNSNLIYCEGTFSDVHYLEFKISLNNCQFPFL